MNKDLNEAEAALAKILNYQNEPEAFDQPGVHAIWIEHKWLPYNYYQRFVKSVIINYFDSINSPVLKDLREDQKKRIADARLEDSREECDKLNKEAPI